ncbi:MAG TPA: hypothetical protein VGH04_02680 [Gemmatimonadaceae bacterium]
MKASPMAGGLDSALTDAASRRMSNQLARAYRGTFGARTGLRIIVLPLARQMIRGGVSPDAANGVLERCVLEHPSRTIGDAQQSMEGAAHSGMLIDLMHECVAAAVLECATPSR